MTLGRTAAVVAAIAAAAGPGACGGDDSEEVQATVREFVRATNERDVDAFCGEVVTEEFLEQFTGATGDRARQACEKQFGALKGLELELLEIKKTEIDGDEAEVTATIESQGQRREQVFRLEKEDGDWRLAGGTGG